jgi:hypothetical protein
VETPTAPERPAAAVVDTEVAAAVVKTLQLDEPTSTSVTESASSESETISPPKKKKPLNYMRCQRINKQFIGCGWRCIHRGGSVGGCVNACGHFLTKRGYKCLHIHGVPFG